MKQTVNLEALNSLKCFNKLSYQAGLSFNPICDMNKVKLITLSTSPYLKLSQPLQSAKPVQLCTLKDLASPWRPPPAQPKKIYIIPKL